MNNSENINLKILFDDDALIFANKSLYKVIRRIRNGSSRESDFETAVTSCEMLFTIAHYEDPKMLDDLLLLLSSGKTKPGLEKALVYYLVDINMLIDAKRDSITDKK